MLEEIRPLLKNLPPRTASALVQAMSQRSNLKAEQPLNSASGGQTQAVRENTRPNPARQRTSTRHFEGSWTTSSRPWNPPSLSPGIHLDSE